MWSTLLYGSDTWTTNKETTAKLEAFEMWCYRKMNKIPWYDKVTNNEVLKLMGEKRKLIITIRSRKIRLFGHIVRHRCLLRDLMEGHLNCKRSRGRPKTIWTTNITDWTGLSYSEAVRSAQDRKLWAAISSNPHVEDGT